MTLDWWVPRLLAAVGLVAVIGYVSIRFDNPSFVPQPNAAGNFDSAGGSSSQGAWIEFETPLGPSGHRVPVHVATALLKKYGVELDLAGPVSFEHVRDSWVDETGQVGIELDTGILLIYTPDDRTPDQFADDAAEVIALGEWEGTVIRLRGVGAKAAEKTESWSAALVWKEGEVVIGMYGHGGQVLSQLVSTAQQMRRYASPGSFVSSSGS